MRVLKYLLLLTLLIVNSSLLIAQDSTVTSFTKVTTLDSAGAFYVVQGAADRHAVWDQMVDAVQDSINGEITNGWIRSNAAIALSKLASGTAAYIIVNNVSGVPTYVALSGDATISNAGVLTIGSNAIGTSEVTNGTLTDDDLTSSLNFSQTPTFSSGANFVAGSAGKVDFYDTVTVNGVSGVFVIEGGAEMLVYDKLDFIGGWMLLPDLSIVSQYWRSLGYLGANGSSILTFDYGDGLGEVDTIGTYRYLLANYFKKSGNNTLSGTNTFTGNVSFNGSVSNGIDSVDVSNGLSPYTISATGLSSTVILYTANTSSTIADFSNGTNGQRITLISAFSNQDQITIDHGTEIHSQTGADVVLADAGDSITLVYYSTYDKWVIVAKEL